jgi:SAM-dependent methyltransferase
METTKKAPWYREWFESPHYDLLYAGRDRREAEKFIEGLMERLSLPKDTEVLDVGCGSGRHAVTLANLGYRVTGIDQSARMIREATRHSHGNPRFLRHDMREPFPLGGFGLVVNLFTSFGFFATRAEHDRSIDNMSAALAPHGHLVLDYLNADHVAANLVPEETIERDGSVFRIERSIDDDCIRKKIRISDKQSGEVLLFEENVRAFRLTDFADMFSHCGLHITEVFGDYDWHTFHPTGSPRLVMMAEKR